jgi:LysM repeat protein
MKDSANFDSCNGVIHVVKKGDTLYKLSKIYRVKLGDIIQANPYVNVYNMQPGEEVCIPVIMQEDFQIYTVKAGDTFEDVLQSTGVSPEDLFKFNPELYKTPIAEGMEISYVDFQN